MKEKIYDLLWTAKGILKGIKFTFKLITSKTFWNEWREAIENNDGDNYIISLYKNEADRICKDN